MYNSAVNVISKIESYGFKAYIVGGYVRDKYIQRNSSDVDICTNATPKDLKKIFSNASIGKEQYGSVSLTYKKIRFEITTFRKELEYSGNRLPVKIKYIDSLEEDLKRRDFTMNTMCINSCGETIDILRAKYDIDEKLIRTVGSPRIKLKEDCLRILRAVRFATTLDFKLESDLRKYIIRYKNLLLKLSFTRKKEELDKIFSSINNKKGIELILELGLKDVLNLPDLDKIVITEDAIGIWSQLYVDDFYPFSNNERELMENIRKIESLNNISLYNNGLYESQIYAEINGISKKEIRKKYMDLPIKNRKDINITSMKICEILNIKPSKKIKEIYLELEYKIINNELINEYEYIEKYLKKICYNNNR